jgi:hypothetical protein
MVGLLPWEVAGMLSAMIVAATNACVLLVELVRDEQDSLDGEITTRLEETDCWAIELALVITATARAYSTASRHGIGSARRSSPTSLLGDGKSEEHPSEPSCDGVSIRDGGESAGIMDHRKEAPSMYEMEGASQPQRRQRSDRSARESAEHATITRQSLGEPRSTRCPPPGKAPFQGGSPVRQTLSRTLGSGHSLSRTPGPGAR